MERKNGNSKNSDNPSEIAKDIKRFTDDSNYLSDRYSSLLSRYPSQWVAVFNKRVQANHKDLEKLLSVLDKKKLPRGKVVIEFLDTEQHVLVL